MSDTASSNTGFVTTAPSELDADSSVSDDSRPPTRGTDAPSGLHHDSAEGDLEASIPIAAESDAPVGIADESSIPTRDDAAPSEAASGLSRLSRTASGEEEHFAVSPIYGLLN